MSKIYELSTLHPVLEPDNSFMYNAGIAIPNEVAARSLQQQKNSIVKQEWNDIFQGAMGVMVNFERKTHQGLFGSNSMQRIVGPVVQCNLALVQSRSHTNHH